MRINCVHGAFLAAFSLAATVCSYAQTAPFTYQGQLTSGGNPFTGNVNLTFRIYNTEFYGTSMGTQTINGVSVENGLFTVTLNSQSQLSSGLFNGLCYLEIDVNGTTLTPRQFISVAPQALFSYLPWVWQGNNLTYGNGFVGIGTQPSMRLEVASEPGDLIGVIPYWLDPGDACRIRFSPYDNSLGAMSVEYRNNNGVPNLALTGGRVIVANGDLEVYGTAHMRTAGTGGDVLTVGGGNTPAGLHSEIVNGVPLINMVNNDRLAGTASASIGGLYRIDGRNSQGNPLFQWIVKPVGGTAETLIGNITQTGSLTVNGSITGAAKNFKIDHPSDPANKYLVHACIESDENRNMYCGNVVLGGDGAAAVEMPSWMEDLNENFTYQLTPVGGAAQLYVSQELQHNTFAIGGGKPGMKVSWVVTGVRKDAYAKANPLVVEQEKIGAEKGRFLHPELFGAGIEQSVGYQTPSADQSVTVSADPR